MNVVMMFVSHFSYLTQAYLYHMTKAIVPSKLAYFKDAVFSDFLVFIPFVLALIFMLDKKKMDSLSFVILAYFIFILFLRNPLDYYLIEIFPFMAITGAGYLTEIWGLFDTKNLRIIFSSILIFLAIFAIFVDLKEVNGYRKEHRFGNAEEIALYVSSDSREGQLFGDYAITPIVAFILSRDIAISSNIDTYPMSVGGVININDFVQDLKAEDPRYILIHESNKGINPLWGADEIKALLENYCNPVKQFFEFENKYNIYECDFNRNI